MKIAFLTQSFNTTDGGGRFSHDLVENLRKGGVEVTEIITENLGILLNFFKIRKIFKNSDIIHAIDVWPNGFYARLISVGLKKSIIITMLGTYSVAPFYSWRMFILKWVCKIIRLIAISNYTKSEIKKVIPELEIEVISPGFNLDFWAGSKADEDEALKFKPYILSVGALKPRKGYHNSIKAFATVAKKTENLNYVIIGQGENSDYSRKLKGIIKENGFENRVFFIGGRIDDNALLGFYRNAELFVLTSIEENHHFEGFGIVYLEAAASGLPIIAAYESGATSATKESYNSILVTQNDPQKTAEAIFKILSDNGLKENMRQNSLEWVKNFSQDKITDKYIRIYNDITANN